MRSTLIATATLAATLLLATGGARAQNACGEGRTLKDGRLSIALSSPIYGAPRLTGRDESSFEVTVASAVAAELGCDARQVTPVDAVSARVRRGGVFLEFPPEPEVDFSLYFYEPVKAVQANAVKAGAESTLESLRGLIWGSMSHPSSVAELTALVDPDHPPKRFGSMLGRIKAIETAEIDAMLWPVDRGARSRREGGFGGVVLGRFQAKRSDSPDRFRLLIDEDSALKPCANAALRASMERGRLVEIEAQWLGDRTGIPVIA